MVRETRKTNKLQYNVASSTEHCFIKVFYVKILILKTLEGNAVLLFLTTLPSPTPLMPCSEPAGVAFLKHKLANGGVGVLTRSFWPQVQCPSRTYRPLDIPVHLQGWLLSSFIRLDFYHLAPFLQYHLGVYSAAKYRKPVNNGKEIGVHLSHATQMKATTWLPTMCQIILVPVDTAANVAHILKQGSVHFINGQIILYEGFAGQRFSTTVTQGCPCSAGAALDSM